jgi:hypothetical protein
VGVLGRKALWRVEAWRKALHRQAEKARSGGGSGPAKGGPKMRLGDRGQEVREGHETANVQLAAPSGMALWETAQERR